MAKTKEERYAYSRERTKRMRKIPGTREWYRRKYERVKATATRRGITFNIAFNDFIIIWEKQMCIFCGAITNLSIDRIVDSLGYELGNIQVACMRCNLYKRNYHVNHPLSEKDHLVIVRNKLIKQLKIIDHKINTL